METKLKVEAGYCPCQGCLTTVKHVIQDVCKRKGTIVVSADVDLENRIITLVGNGIDIQKLVDKLHKKRRSSKIIILPSHAPKTISPPSSPLHREVGESTATMEVHSLLLRRSRVLMSSPTESMPPHLARKPNYAPQPQYGSPSVESMPPQLARQPNYTPQLQHQSNYTPRPHYGSPPIESLSPQLARQQKHAPPPECGSPHVESMSPRLARQQKYAPRSECGSPPIDSMPPQLAHKKKYAPQPQYGSRPVESMPPQLARKPNSAPRQQYGSPPIGSMLPQLARQPKYASSVESLPPQLTRQEKYYALPRPQYEESPHGFNYDGPRDGHYQIHDQDHPYGQIHHHYGLTEYQQGYKYHLEIQNYDTRPIYPHDYDSSCSIM